jgi:hypothetical protein
MSTQLLAEIKPRRGLTGDEIVAQAAECSFKESLRPGGFLGSQGFQDEQDLDAGLGQTGGHTLATDGHGSIV